MDQQNPMISLVCIDLWERLNSRIDFGNFNETEMENRIRSSLQIIHGYLKDVCVCVCVYRWKEFKGDRRSPLIIT